MYIESRRIVLIQRAFVHYITKKIVSAQHLPSLSFNYPVGRCQPGPEQNLLLSLALRSKDEKKVEEIDLVRDRTSLDV